MSDSNPKWTTFFQVLVFAIGALLRVYLIVETPIAGRSHNLSLCSYNDEMAHGSYALQLLRTGKLPRSSESVQAQDALSRGLYENYQPPLFYSVVAASGYILGATQLSSVVLIGRFLNAAAMAGLVWLWYLIAREFRLDRRGTLAGIALLAVGGVFTRFTTTCTNDVFFWIAAGALILLSIRLTSRAHDLRLHIAFAIVAILGIYTKLTTVVLIPLLFLPVATEVRRLSLTASTATFVAIVLLTLPVWVRNLTQFGSLIPLSAGFGVPAWRFPDFETLLYAVRSLVFPWSEFWQGWLGIALMSPQLLLFTAAGTRRAFLNLLIRNRVILGAALLTIAAFVFLNMRYDQAEGRYLLLAWPIFCLAVASVSTTLAMCAVLLLCLLSPYLLMVLPAGA